MTKHYHVLPTVGGNTAITTLTYDNYEDAIYRFVALTTQMFSDSMEDNEGLSIENALAATAGGTDGASSGDEVLAFIFLPCEAEPCVPYNLN